MGRLGPDIFYVRFNGLFRLLVSVAGPALLSGCFAVGPDYQPPTIEAPPTWHAVAQVEPQNPETLARWWEEFSDPVLTGLVQDAIAANPNIATAKAQLRQARAETGVAGAALGPTVDGSFSGTRSQSSKETGSGSIRNSYSAGMDASWEADIFGANRRGLEAAEADAQAAEESLRDVQVSIVAEVVTNYITLRVAEARLALAQDNLADQTETYDIAVFRQQAGLVSELDVIQARADLDSERASLPSLRTTAATARHRLAILLDLAPGALSQRLAANTSDIPFLARDAAVGIPADTLRQRPDVRQAERKLAAQTARLGVAEAARYPSFKLSGSLGLDALTIAALQGASAGAWSLAAAISAPIFQSGRLDANVESADAQVDQARLAYRTAILTALEDVENALVTLNNALERRDRLIEATQSAQQADELARQRYSGGLVDFLTVLDSQRTLRNLEDSLASNAGDVATAQAQLYKALGGGWGS